MTTTKSALVLHIGTEKTGTTSIQHFLYRNRHVLLDHSILYPSSAGGLNHIKLGAYAAADCKRDDLRASLGIRSQLDLERFRRSFERKLSSQLRRRGCGTVILSSEHCHSRLTTLAEIVRLRQLLDPLAEQIKIVVYFRRQDKMAVSAFSSELKYGNSPPPIIEYFDNIDQNSVYYNFFDIYSLWTTAFGENNVIVRIYQVERFVEGDLLSDFMAVAGITASPRFIVPERRNPSLSCEALEFLRHFNPHAPRLVDGKIDRRRYDLIRILEEEFGGGGCLPSRTAAVALYDRFRQSNERLRSALGAESLFEEDFSGYPDDAIRAPLSVEQAASIAAVLWKGMHHRQAARGNIWERCLKLGREPRVILERFRDLLAAAYAGLHIAAWPDFPGSLLGF